MARIFIIKASKGKNDFYMTEGTEFIYFYSPTLKDLRATLRCILAKGYKVRKEASLGKLITNHNGHLIGLNPFFKTTMYEIFELKETLTIKKELEYENSFGFKHNLKIVDGELAENRLEQCFKYYPTSAQTKKKFFIFN